MIHDARRLNEVIDEISQWTLVERRQYINEISNAFGPASAQQIKDALTARWAAAKA